MALTMKIFAFAAVCTSTAAVDFETVAGPSKHMEAFDAFIQLNGRSYKKGSDEYHQRLTIFSSHMSKAEKINTQPFRLWTAGPSPLADLREEEKQQKLGWFGSASATRGHGATANMRGSFLNQVSVQEDKLPKDVSWAHLKTLQDVPDQGSCGSCWAVASATVLAAHAEIHKSSQRSFSAEELVACVGNPRQCGGTGGCEGATVELAMNYTLNSGLATESEVPYKAKDENCMKHRAAAQAKHESSMLSMKDSANSEIDDKQLEVAGVHNALSSAPGLSFRMHGWEKLGENRYMPLLRAVHERGPVAISADASEWSLYSGGIFDQCNQDAVINHAITLIGYGQEKLENQEKPTKYWLVQNSWGNNFGESGRIRLLRQDTDEKNCGIDKQPQQGTGCKDGPAEVKVCGQCGMLYDSVVPHFK